MRPDWRDPDWRAAWREASDLTPILDEPNPPPSGWQEWVGGLLVLLLILVAPFLLVLL